ncbi:MAG: methyl-accepting chemotaxis protein, partial [Longimicrobiales bacterium]
FSHASAPAPPEPPERAMGATPTATRWMGHLPVGRKLMLIAMVFVLALATLLVSAVQGFRSVTVDDAIANAMGRQRLLGQLIIRELTLAPLGLGEELVGQGPEELLAIMDRSNRAFLDGGLVILDAETDREVEVEPISVPEVRSILERQQNHIDGLRDHLTLASSLPRDGPAFDEALRAVVAEADSILELAHSARVTLTLRSAEDVRGLLRNLFWLSLAVTVAGLGAAFLVSRQITTPLTAVVERARRVAEGELRFPPLPAHTRDEIGNLTRAFNDMLAGLHQLTTEARAVTESVTSASAQIFASTQQQASSTQEQFAALQETGSTVEELGQSASQIAERSRALSHQGQATGESSRAGIKAIEDSSAAMDAIQEQVESLAERVIALSQGTQAVGDIISTVTRIAERSNLVALNAAIEAAAAGEQGQTFSVVAEEMRSLSEQAREATVQIRGILEDVRKGIDTSVMLTEEAVKRVEAGRAQVKSAEEAMDQLAANVEMSVQGFQQISAATNQQEIGFDQLTRALQDISRAAEQTALGTRELEQATSDLNGLSTRLQDALNRYRT